MKYLKLGKYCQFARITIVQMRPNGTEKMEKCKVW